MLGRMFAADGYVVFFPFRRGQGLSEGQGTAWAAQLTQEGLAPGDSAFFRRMTELLVTTQLADVRAAIAAMRARREVNPRRVVVSGISFGGILTLLAAEADSTLRAAVAFAPAAMNWGPNAPCVSDSRARHITHACPRSSYKPRTTGMWHPRKYSGPLCVKAATWERVVSIPQSGATRSPATH
jgi:dienelactone hydrolase